jgi:hypothetical protein
MALSKAYLYRHICQSRGLYHHTLESGVVRGRHHWAADIMTPWSAQRPDYWVEKSNFAMLAQCVVVLM